MFESQGAEFDFDFNSFFNLINSYSNWNERKMVKQYIVKKVLDKTLDGAEKRVGFLAKIMNQKFNGDGNMPENLIEMALSGGVDFFSQVFELWQSADMPNE